MAGTSHQGAGTDPEHYEYYFSSGYYDRRYPRPNPNVLGVVRNLLPPGGGHVIDYGCGSGRYVLALAGQAARCAGFDICRSALARFREAWQDAPRTGHVYVLGPDPESLDRHVADHGPADVVTCLFGVLSHIEGAALRQATLRRLAGLLKPETGRLVISVPNRRRRFRREQRQAGEPESGEIRYARTFDGRRVEFFYKLYDPQSLRQELEDAGFAVEHIAAESVAPESAVANWRAVQALDRAAVALVPPQWGYGLLSVARPLSAPAPASAAPVAAPHREADHAV